MKPLFLLLLALLVAAGAVRAQELRGGYRLELPKGRPRFGTSAYWFGNGRFKEFSAGCTEGHMNEGTFTRVGNRLTLRYDEWQQPASMFTATPLAADSSQSAFEVVVLDAQTKLPLRQIEIHNSSNQDIRHLSNDEGRAFVRQVKPFATADTLIVSQYLDAHYVPLRIPARLVQGQRLTVLLAPKIQRQSSGYIATYLIQSLTPTTLTLQFADPDLTDYLIHYSRLSAAETHQLFQSVN